MIQEIFASLFFFVLIYLSSLGYGIVFKKLIFGYNIDNSLGETGIFGLFFLSFISILFHFLIPLSSIFNSIILCLGLIFIFFSKHLKENYLKLEYFIIFLVITPSIFLFEYHADYFWYHLPYINLVSDFKIIFGAANLNDNLGYGHIWYDLLAIFNLPFFGTKYLSILSILFLTFFLIFLKDIFSKTNQNLIKLFCFFSFCFVCLTYSNSKDYGSEIQSNLIYLIISLLILKYYSLKDKEFKDYIIISIILFFYYAILIRTNSIIFIPLIFLFFVHNFNYFIKTIKNYKIFYFFLILFSTLYLLKNFVLTGCLAYPIYFTCSDIIDWGVGVEQAKLRFNHLSAQSKGYLLYLVNENFIENIFDYYKFRENQNFISPENYMKDYNWISIWWKYEYDINRFLNIIFFFIISLTLVVLFNYNKINYNKIFENIKTYYLQILFFIFPIFTWFFLLPQTRYGGYGIIFSITCLLSLMIIFKIDKIKVFPFFIIFAISISYFEYKNINRIINNYYGLNSKELINFYNYPSIKNNRYKINNDFGMSITERILNDEDKLGKPLYCFNIKGLCGSSFRLNCIKKIYKKNEYLFVISDQKKCASIIDEYLWY
tara:strand:+ start:421 stop:2226 length:1806 start_codon:yes stop_codon:yes gene_type:complete